MPLPDSESGPPLDLDALRARLRAARAERGACPPWEELRADLLPGGARRPGRDERLAHRDLCPYCDAHVREWERSIDKTADTLAAVEEQVARGVVDGALRLVTLGKPRPADPPVDQPARSTPPPPAPAPPPLALAPPPPASSPRPAEPPAPPRKAKSESPAPPRKAKSESPAPPRKATPAEPASPMRLLVVEATAVERIPPSVFLCAEVLGVEVAHVHRVDELAGDPDLDAVCAIIFAGARPSAEWPEAVRRGRDLAPGRPVLVLAGGGAMPSEGARRALAGALLSDDDPAERLLLALDPRLR